MERAVTHADSVYKIPNYRAVGRVCRTNLPPNTAFRGFGGPQGLVITEQIVQNVAEHLPLPSEQVNTIKMEQFDIPYIYNYIYSRVNFSILLPGGPIGSVGN